jgi:multidrug efflux pump subunit AcrB
MEDAAKEAIGNKPIIIDYQGASKQYKESSGALLFTFGFALLIVYLTLAAQFESFVHPAVIMVTAPLAMAGGAFGLFMFDQTLNIYSQIGFVILIALSAKNGILIVEFANQLRDEGRDVRSAITEAAQMRLRPILMTSIATIAGRHAARARPWRGNREPRRHRHRDRVRRRHRHDVHASGRAGRLRLCGALHQIAGNDQARDRGL